MPLYEFFCKDCDFQFDDFKSYKERRTSDCPKCGNPSEKMITFNVGTAIDASLRDSVGQPIWFPRDNQPYFDPTLRQTFNSKKDKQEYMNKNNLIMEGSETKITADSGDLRSKAFRKQMRMED